MIDIYKLMTLLKLLNLLFTIDFKYKLEQKMLTKL